MIAINYKINGLFDGAQQVTDDSHAGIDAVLGLFEIVGFRIAVHVGVDLPDARQRMQDAHVGFGIFQHTVFEDINVLHAFVLHRIGETFALHAGHVDDIGVAERLFDAAGFGVRNPFSA